MMQDLTTNKHNYQDGFVPRFMVFSSVFNLLQEKTMKKILDRSLKLPPVEERWMPEGTVKNLFYPNFSKERNDTYVYFIVLLLGFVVTALFSILYLSTYYFDYEINLGLIEIGLSQNEPVRDFIYSFPFVVPTFLFMTILPFGIFLFLRNVDITNLDLLFSEGIKKWRREDKKRFYFNLKLFFIIGCAVTFGSYGMPELILNNYNYGVDFSQSIKFIIFFSAVFSFAYPLCVNLIMISIFLHYQNKKELGPYYNNKKGE